MQDRVATMMIIRSLQDIGSELKAIRQELHQLTRTHAHKDTDFVQGFSEQTEMEAFEVRRSGMERGR
jgi:hypothetical protein